MTRHLRTHASFAIVVAVLIAGVALQGASIARQFPAGMLAGWKDLDTWAYEFADSRDTEFGLGLQLSGPGGTMLVSFASTVLRREPNAPPKDVLVTVAPSFAVNPNIVRSANLSFLVTGRDKKQTTIDLSGRVAIFPPGPFGPGGSNSSSGRASMTPAEFAQLIQADKLTATVLGLGVTFRPEQIKALQALADRVHLTPPRKRRG